MVARFCSQCGAPATPGDRFCRTCGGTLIEPTLDLPGGLPPQYGIDEGSKPLAHFDVEYPERLSRGLIFIKWLLAVPHLIILYLYGAAAGIVVFIAWFAILFTGRFPRAMFDFVLGLLRWQANVSAYVGLLRDEYPPFSNADGVYPVRLALAYPSHLSRGLIFIKWLLIIPNIVVFYFVGLAALVCTVIAWFAILFSGRYPEGLFRFVVGAHRWSMRLTAYYYLMTDRYPPFTTADVPGS